MEYSQTKQMQYQMYAPYVSDEFWISPKIQVDLDKKVLSQDVQVNDLINMLSLFQIRWYFPSLFVFHFQLNFHFLLFIYLKKRTASLKQTQKPQL